VHGIPRQTQDIDIVADLSPKAVPPLVEQLDGEFYVDRAAAERAVARKDSFNLIHHATAIKVDVFVQGDDPFDRSEMGRSHRTRLESGSPAGIFVKSPEDTILRKLRRYRDGGDVSERQWLDVLSIFRVQGSRLEQEYLKRWSRHLAVEDLLDHAIRES
jgi:hypothetical protein